MNKQLLFRITRQRMIVLDGVITTLKNMVENNEGLFLDMINNDPDPVNRDERLKKIKEETVFLKLYHDVLETVICHNHDFNLEMFRFEERTWKNEWDIQPLLFEQAITYLVTLMESYQNRTNNVSIFNRRQKQINLLKEILAFRKKHESNQSA